MLLEPWDLGRSTAPSRVFFGPHVTNLGDARSFGARHVAYYARRAAGGAGVVVTETASVHDSDWPYERAPLARECQGGWHDIATAVHEHGALVVASLGHCGLQGSTTYSQGVLWAPSLVANVMTHEMPMALDQREITELRDATRASAARAVAAGCDGVELNAGQFSLWRQFMSGLTNQRDDQWAEPSALVAATLADLRAEIGTSLLGVRVSADELAPWAGITPGLARELLARIDTNVDYVVIERGSIFSESATRADMQGGANVNREILVTLRGALRDGVAVVAQGSIVSVHDAAQMLSDGLAHAVEMTRAQIADPDVVNKAAGRTPGAIRPCVLCNQGCQVRDVRNPLVSCTMNPTAGYELTDGALDQDAANTALEGRVVRVRGAGPAGLEAARRAGLAGARVTLLERSDHIGGALCDAASLPGRDRWNEAIAWFASELARLNVSVELSVSADDEGADVVATGARRGRLVLRDGDDDSVPTCSARDVLARPPTGGRVAVIDPVGGVLGVGLAELLAREGCAVSLISVDLVAGTQLSLSGDLVDANARLSRWGVDVLTHRVAVAVRAGTLVLEDRFSGTPQDLACDLIVNAGFDEPGVEDASATTIGDALAPRSVHAAILEGRRVIERLVAQVGP